MKRYIRFSNTQSNKAKYYAMVNTKYVGMHRVDLKAKTDEDAKAEAKKLENENNKVVKLVKINKE